MTVKVDRVVTSGTFSLDGGTWDVDNNIWLIGDDSEVVVVDAAHTAQPIIDAVAGRRVVAVICTHGHNDHVTVAPQLGEELDAPVLLHPADEVLWEMTHPGVTHGTLADGQRISVAGTEIQVLHTPGHSPGSSCLYVQEAGVLCTGDT
ncbi:MAG: MBL fold metallo-hydrolase, partial [Mycobacteriaceae bacterium]